MSMNENTITNPEVLTEQEQVDLVMSILSEQGWDIKQLAKEAKILDQIINAGSNETESKSSDSPVKVVIADDNIGFSLVKTTAKQKKIFTFDAETANSRLIVVNLKTQEVISNTPAGRADYATIMASDTGVITTPKDFWYPAFGVGVGGYDYFLNAWNHINFLITDKELQPYLVKYIREEERDILSPIGFSNAYNAFDRLDGLQHYSERHSHKLLAALMKEGIYEEFTQFIEARYSDQLSDYGNIIIKWNPEDAIKFYHLMSKETYTDSDAYLPSDGNLMVFKTKRPAEINAWLERAMSNYPGTSGSRLFGCLVYYWDVSIGTPLSNQLYPEDIYRATSLAQAEIQKKVELLIQNGLKFLDQIRSLNLPLSHAEISNSTGLDAESKLKISHSASLEDIVVIHQPTDAILVINSKSYSVKAVTKTYQFKENLEIQFQQKLMNYFKVEEESNE